MTSKRHWTELPDKDKHPESDASTGCLYKHVTGHAKSPTYPACAYKYNSVEESKSVRSKRSLYELDPTDGLKGSWRTGAKERLTAAQRLMGKTFVMKTARGPTPASGTKDSHKPVNPMDDKDAWKFDKGQNYENELRPFKHEHHHILPEETVFEVLEKPEEREILQTQVKYNINSRLNMIILPCTWDVAHVLGLPRHAGRHGKETAYAVRCVTELNKFRAKFNQIKDEDCPDTKGRISGDTKRQLERMQQELYWLLVKWGRAEAQASRKAHINKLPATLTL
ncbi:AHH domain-containing protein [Myxococcaceae bacterium JPH2]|nr:AHH domain-containing protein [Myxococcaceae bacterium JPH2]